MKVAITCDSLIGKNHYTEMIETICELFPEARIYTFAHKVGSISARIEQRKITSTHLSNLVQSEEEFYEHSSKIPLLARNLFISCEYDLIINISRGLSHGMKKCEKSKLITYLYDIGFEGKVKKSLIQKLAYPWFLNYFVNSFKNADSVWVSRPDLRDDLARYIKDAEVVSPPFKINDYSLFPKDMFLHQFYLVDTNFLNLEMAIKLVAFFKDTKREFKFIGPDEHLEILKSDPTYSLNKNQFFGNKCSGEHAPMLAASKMFLSFNSSEFPKMSMGALSTGRPVLILDNQLDWIKGTGVYSIKEFSIEQISNVLEVAEKEIDSLDCQKLRALVNPYHEIKFKSFLKRFIDKKLEIH